MLHVDNTSVTCGQHQCYMWTTPVLHVWAAPVLHVDNTSVTCGQHHVCGANLSIGTLPSVEDDIPKFEVSVYNVLLQKR